MLASQPFGGDSFYLSDVSAKDKPWDTHRSLAEEVAALYKLTKLLRYAERINECSRLLEFALKATDEGEIKLRLQLAKFCRVRHCPVCQWRRSSMWRARLFKVLPQVVEAYPTARWIFLTLTVKNPPLDELRDTVAWMNKAWQLLTKRKEFPALGFVKSLEVTRAKDGLAHPHFHCLLLVPAGYFKRGYLSQAKWTELWQSCLKADYVPIVDIKVVKDRRSKASIIEEPDNGLVKAICETFKYSIKPSDLVADANWLEGLTNQLHKTRAIATGGILKQYLSEEEPEDLIHVDDEVDEASEADPKIRFGWRERVRRYAKE